MRDDARLPHFPDIARKSCNILEKLGKEEWLFVRKIIIDMVLASDKSKHFDLMHIFKS